ncbi:hypothetical protein HUK83_19465, partial [Endobacter medicaginis]|nr:hypothetical protein [Endobacter medicaginis]
MRRRLLMIVPAVIVLLLVAGFLSLGAFPPHPHVQAVDHAVPMERLAPPPAAPVALPAL